MQNQLDYFLDILIMEGFNLFFLGHEVCKPSHSYGPAVREFYLLHLVTKGSGVYVNNNIEYKISAGQGFVICPEEVTYYEASSNDPWEYYWVAFKGDMTESYFKKAGLSKNTPIFNYSGHNYLEDCINTAKLYNISSSIELELIGYTYLFLSEINKDIKNCKINNTISKEEEYVRAVLDFIHVSYYRTITVSKIAKHIGLDISYLGSVFKKVMGYSIRSYLISYRMNKAVELLKREKLTIGDISRSVGYKDQLQFSKAFKKVKGVSPSKYRELHFSGK